jgi:glycosyltransferase involved in cell wall biosynthesis
MALSAMPERDPSARPLRVLHVITRLIVGGAQENTLLTAIGQRQRGMEVTLVAGPDPGPEGDLHDAARKGGIPLQIFPRLVRPIRPLNDLLALRELFLFIKRGDFDVVHTHSSKAGILGRIAARLAGVDTVVHTIHGHAFHAYQAAWKNALYVSLERIAAPCSDTLIAVSQKTIETALAARIGKPEQYVKIFSGMELDPFLRISERLSVAEARRKFSIPADAPVVGKIARLFPLKGHSDFLSAAARIAAEVPECRFLLIGDGILRRELEEEARRLGIDERTIFAGLVPPEEVATCIQAMDVVVHASLREGIARVLPQAGAVGKPVVAYELDGAPEVVLGGGSGFVVPAGDVAALSRRTIELLRNPSLRNEMGSRGRAFAAEHYPAAQMVDAIEAVYARARARPAISLSWRDRSSCG